MFLIGLFPTFLIDPDMVDVVLFSKVKISRVKVSTLIFFLKTILQTCAIFLLLVLIVTISTFYIAFGFLAFNELQTTFK